MVKKALILNRRMIRHITPVMFSLGSMFCIVIGLGVLSGELNVDLSEEPHWYGLFLIYGGMFIFLSYLVDFVYRVVAQIKSGFKTNNRKSNSLLQRIEYAEKG